MTFLIFFLTFPAAFNLKLTNSPNASPLGLWRIQTDLCGPPSETTSPRWPTPQPLGRSGSWSGCSRAAERQGASRGSETTWPRIAPSASRTLLWTEGQKQTEGAWTFLRAKGQKSFTKMTEDGSKLTIFKVSAIKYVQMKPKEVRWLYNVCIFIIFAFVSF